LTIQAQQPAVGSEGAGRHSPGSGRWGEALRVGNISLVYMYVLGFILFTVLVPHLWLDGVTQRSILNISFAVPAILALGLLIPLLAGVFDLSIGGTMESASVMIATLLIYDHMPLWLGIVITLIIGAFIGIVNGVLVAVIGIDSFIATLGTSSVLSAFAVWRSGGIQITGFKSSFASFGGGNIGGGIQSQVLYLVIIALVIWYMVEHTPVGRYLQATGENEEAARLAGIRTKRYIFASLVVSAVVAAFAGIVETSLIGAGESNLGDPYLLSAFAACFLGATQFKQRFNVAGTVAGVWVLASGVEGVTLSLKSYAWLNSLFFGIALIVAVAIGRAVEIKNGRVAIRRRADLPIPGEPSATGAVLAARPVAGTVAKGTGPPDDLE